MHASRWFGATLVTLALSAGTALADDTNFETILSGDQEVPPVDTPAMGVGTFVLSEDQTMLSYEITFEGLVAPETAAHIHNAPVGVNGPVVFNLGTGSPKVGTWDIPAEMVTELLAGNLYVNVHSEEFPGGEIRGQIEKVVSTPVDEGSWGRIKSLY